MARDESRGGNSGATTLRVGALQMHGLPTLAELNEAADRLRWTTLRLAEMRALDTEVTMVCASNTFICPE